MTRPAPCAAQAKSASTSLCGGSSAGPVRERFPWSSVPSRKRALGRAPLLRSEPARFLVGREDALLGLERFGTPVLSSHELAGAARPKDLVHSVCDDFGRNLVTLDAHRLLDTS